MPGVGEDRVGYQHRMKELQEKLRKSEDERSKLEEKFSIMMKSCREEEAARLSMLRAKYDKFLEAEKRRRERNEHILETLNRIESRTTLLTAKSERLHQLKRHYEAYVASMYPALSNADNKSHHAPSTTPSISRSAHSDETLSRNILQRESGMFPLNPVKDVYISPPPPTHEYLNAYPVEPFIAHPSSVPFPSEQHKPSAQYPQPLDTSFPYQYSAPALSQLPFPVANKQEVSPREEVRNYVNDEVTKRVVNDYRRRNLFPEESGSGVAVRQVKQEPVAGWEETGQKTRIPDGSYMRSYETKQDWPVKQEPVQSWAEPQFRKDLQNRDYKNRIEDDRYGTSLQGGKYKGHLQAGGYKAGDQNGKHRTNLQDEAWRAGPQDQKYKIDIQDQGYRAGMQDEGYKTVLHDDGYRVSPQEIGYKTNYHDQGYRAGTQDSGYKTNLQLTDYIGRAAELLKYKASDEVEKADSRLDNKEENKQANNSVDYELEQNTSGDLLNMSLSDDGLLNQDEADSDSAQNASASSDADGEKVSKHGAFVAADRTAIPQAAERRFGDTGDYHEKTDEHKIGLGDEKIERVLDTIADLNRRGTVERYKQEDDTDLISDTNQAENNVEVSDGEVREEVIYDQGIVEQDQDENSAQDPAQFVVEDVPQQREYDAGDAVEYVLPGDQDQAEYVQQDLDRQDYVVQERDQEDYEPQNLHPGEYVTRDQAEFVTQDGTEEEQERYIAQRLQQVSDDQGHDVGEYATHEQGEYASQEQSECTTEQVGNVPEDRREYAREEQGEYVVTDQREYTPQEQTEYTTQQQSDYATEDQGKYISQDQREYTPQEQEEYTTQQQSDYATEDQGKYISQDQREYTPQEQEEYTSQQQSEYVTDNQGEYIPQEQREYTPQEQEEYTSQQQSEYVTDNQGEYIPQEQREYTPQEQEEYTSQQQSEYVTDNQKQYAAQEQGQYDEEQYTSQEQGEYTSEQQGQHVLQEQRQYEGEYGTQGEYVVQDQGEYQGEYIAQDQEEYVTQPGEYQQEYVQQDQREYQGEYVEQQHEYEGQYIQQENGEYIAQQGEYEGQSQGVYQVQGEGNESQQEYFQEGKYHEPTVGYEDSSQGSAQERGREDLHPEEACVEETSQLEGYTREQESVSRAPTQKSDVQPSVNITEQRASSRPRQSALAMLDSDSESSMQIENGGLVSNDDSDFDFNSEKQ